MDYLLKIQRTYYCRILIPKDLQDYFPSKIIKRSLHTTSKTNARKLLTAALYDIQQAFFNIRLGAQYMALPTQIQQAIAIYRKRYGAKASIYEKAQPGEPGLPNVPGWKYKDEIWKIEAKLSAGYDVEGDGFFHLVDAPEFGLLAPVAISKPSPSRSIPPTFTREELAAAKPSLTLAEARKLYIAHCINPTKKYVGKPRAANTLASEEQSLDKLTAFLKSDKILLSDMPDDYHEFAVHLKDRGKLRTSSISKCFSCLSRFFIFLHEYKHIDTIPLLKRLTKMKDEKLRKSNKSYSNEQLQALFCYLIDNKPRLFKARKKYLGLIYLFLGLAHNGCRVTEFAEECKIIKHNNIPVFDIPTMTKDLESSVRYIPVHRNLIQLGYVEFFNKHGFPNIRNIGKVLDAALQELGIKKDTNEYTIHSFRSTFDTTLNGKIPDGLRRRLMGHTLAGSDADYVHQPPDAAAMYLDAVDKLQYKIDYPRLKTYLKTETTYLYG